MRRDDGATPAVCCACGGSIDPDAAVDAGGGDVACGLPCADAMRTDAPAGATTLGIVLLVLTILIAIGGWLGWVGR